MIPGFRTRAAAIGVGAVLVMSVPGVANAAAPSVAPTGASIVAADPVYPPVLQQVSCKASAVKSRTRIRINMGPNLPGDQYYIFRLEKRTSDGWVRYLKKHRTQGRAETRTVNVPKGTWRAKCYGTAFPIAAPALDATSSSVKIRR